MSVTNILFVVHNLAIGGAEKMLINIINRLNRTIFRSVVVSLGWDNPLHNDIDHGAAEVFIFTRKWRYDLSPSRNLRKIIIERHIEYVICFDFYTFFFVRLALMNWQGKRPKIFISEHTTIPTGLKDYFQTSIYTRLLHPSDRIITVCNAQADYLSKKYTIPRTRFVTIYNGIDTNYFAPDQVVEPRDILRHQFDIPKHANVILQVANFSKVKRHEDALTALKILKDKRPDLCIFYVAIGGGDNNRRKKMKLLAEKMGMSKNTIFAGVRKDVRGFYRIASCVLFSSLSETFPIAALEAMSMGLPCVMTNTGGAREMIKQKFNGLLVPSRQPEKIAEALSYVIESPKEFNADAIRQYVVSKFSLSRCIKEYTMLFTEEA